MLPDNEIEALLHFSSVIKWQGKFYYLLKEKLIKFNNIEYFGYSISNNIERSFKDKEGVVILKKDLEKIEEAISNDVNQSRFQSKSLQTSVMKSKNTEPNEKQIMLSQPNLKIVTKFGESDVFLKYGKQVPQNLIKDWLIQNCEHEGNRRVLKEIINLWYNISTGRVKDRLLTIC